MNIPIANGNTKNSYHLNFKNINCNEQTDTRVRIRGTPTKVLRMATPNEHLYQTVERLYPRQLEVHLDYESTFLKQINWLEGQEDTQALICSGEVFTKLHYDAGSASLQMITEGQKRYIYVDFILNFKKFKK